MLFDLFKRRNKTNDNGPGKSQRAFFEQPENKHLFANCPYRKAPAHLHRFDAHSVDNILAHLTAHIIEHKAGQPCRNEKNELISAIDQDGIEDELRYVYNDCNNAALTRQDRSTPTQIQPTIPNIRASDLKREDVLAPMHARN